MQVNIDKYLGAVTREVASRDYEGRPARVVILRRDYPTTVLDLWDALTSPERIPRWFLPITGDLRLGGVYQFEGNAGGKITACDPPRLVAVTWEFGGGVSWLTVRLAERPGSTSLELEHVAPVEGEFWDQFGPGAVGVGWDLALIGLGLHLDSGAAVDRMESAAWSVSEEGKAFARGSSDAWRQASIAAGTDEDAATAAAVRTTAFYTGDPPA